MVRNTKPILIAVLATLTVGGCTGPQSQPGAVATGAGDNSPSKRFSDSAGGRTTVESAIELSEKYARLSDQTVALREENQRLTTENQSLRQQTTTLDAKLQQTQKELSEANALLLEMLTELNTWKSNILGFRGEMREASRAQLEGLLKVLEILGGEAEAGTLERRHADILKSSEGNAPQAKLLSAPVKNEPNAPSQSSN